MLLLLAVSAHAVECDTLSCQAFSSTGHLWDLDLITGALTDGTANTWDGAGQAAVATDGGPLVPFEAGTWSVDQDRVDLDPVWMDPDARVSLREAWYFPGDRPVAWQLLSLSNASALPAVVEIVSATELGSGPATNLYATSLGGATLTAADVWVVDTGNGETGPPFAGVRWGDGSLALDGAPALGTIHGDAANDLLELRWTVSLEPGEQAAFLIAYTQAWQGDETVDALVALDDAAAFTEGLRPEEIPTVRNFGLADADRDGDPDLAYGGTDCDDAAADVHGGAPEVCDGVDQDCDGEIDEGLLGTWYTDADGDGHGADAVHACAQPDGTVLVDDDCDDASAAVHPGQTEGCDDGADDDCDGAVDEGCTAPTNAVDPFEADVGGAPPPTWEPPGCATAQPSAGSWLALLALSTLVRRQKVSR